MENIKKHKNTILGILALAIGALLLMDNLQIIDAPISRYVFSWKTLFLALGVYLLVVKQKLTAGIILISLGVTFWLPVIFSYQFSLNQIFLPAMLITAGSLVILHNYLAKRSVADDPSGNSNSTGNVIEADSVEVEPAK